MKISSFVLWVVASSFITSASLHGQKVDLSVQLGQIRELLKPDKEDSPEAKRVKAALQNIPDTWQSLLESDQLGSFSEYGARNFGGSDLSAVPELAAKLEAFTTSLKEEIARWETAKIAEAEALLAQVGEKLKGAKKPEDLDALMLALSKTKISDYARSPRLSALSRELQGALQIANNWQEYLIAVETGNSQTSRSSLQQISQLLATTPILPRSFILRLLNPQAAQPAAAKEGGIAEPRIALDTIQTKLSESGDSATALAQLKAIPKMPLGGSDDGYFLRAVQAVEDLRKLEPAMAESEVFANIRTIQGSQSQGRYSLALAIDQIALNAIARNFGIETPSAKVASARKVLEAIALSARQQLDWPKLRKAISSLDAFGAAGYGSSGYSTETQKRSNDLKIMALLELAKAAEQHNDIEAAVSAYLEASGIDGQYLQREVAYGKLATLKEKFPDKVAPVLTKAEEGRQRAEAARYAAELESRNQMMTNRGMSNERLRRDELTNLRPMVQEVVAEFLKDKRLEALKVSDPAAKPKEEPAKKTEP